jgi:adenine-specific DNA-methyltransferase
MTFEINRTELVWPGKYDTEGNLVLSPPASLPFQVIERINETRATRATREKKIATLFDVWNADQEGQTFEDGWRNKLVWGDNKLVMESLLENYANKIDLIYIDPPFAVGSDFSIDVEIGDQKLTKDSSIIEEVAYRDTWGKNEESYLSMIYGRLYLMKELLNSKGTIYVHIDYRLSAKIRLLCDEIFGASNFRNEITWRRQIPRGRKIEARHMPFSADYILIYTKSDESTWNPIRKTNFISIAEAEKKYMKDEKGYFRTSDPGSYTNESLVRLFNEGRIYVTNGGIAKVVNNFLVVDKGSIGIKYYREKVGNVVKEETIADNIWEDIPGMGVVSGEYLGYPTQKPKALLRRIIEASSNPGDLVADFFCGSGTTISVAEELGRKWIGSDLGRFAIHTTRKRLLEIEDCKQFEILNLGNYERQYWSNISFGEDLDGDGRISLLEYVSFILKLYGAAAISGGVQLHGKHNHAFVHVGSVDSPVTIQEIEDSINECAAMKGSELHVLGWEWEMGLIDTLTNFAKSKGVKLLALQIPREVMETEAARKGQIKFYELSYLETSIEKIENSGEYVCSLEDFVIPNPELVPDEVREKVKAWSDYVDYWAVDWDFQNDTFMPKWMDYRTKQDRSLSLKSGKNKFDKPGEYKVMVKVVDIFGNDTTKILELTVK